MAGSVVSSMVVLVENVLVNNTFRDIKNLLDIISMVVVSDFEIYTCES